MGISSVLAICSYEYPLKFLRTITSRWSKESSAIAAWRKRMRSSFSSDSSGRRCRRREALAVRVVVVEERFVLLRFALDEVETSVSQDPVEPGVKGPALLELLSRLVRLDERVLRQVPRVLGIPREAQRDEVSVGHIAPDQLSKGVLVPSSPAPHQFFLVLEQAIPPFTRRRRPRLSAAPLIQVRTRSKISYSNVFWIFL